MAYLGNAPARSFISFERQVFTIVNSQTAYTLSHSVTNENDIRLVVNNVVQEPGSGKAYTASGTTLTLSAALTNGTDEMYCVFLGRAVGTVNAPAGSVGTSQLAADAVTNAKIADDAISDEQLDSTVITGQTAETSIATDDLILLSDTSASGALKKMTRANFVSGVGGANTPYVRAYASGNQNMSNATTTKVEFGGETFDSGNNFASSRFTPTTAGKYFITTELNTTYSGTAPVNEYLYLRKNGSTIMSGSMRGNGHGYGFNFAADIVEFNGSSDYVEVFAYGDNTTAYIIEGGSGGYNSNFTAFKIIE